MKKIKFILLGLLSLFVFAGCSDGSGGVLVNRQTQQMKRQNRFMKIS